jgi:hypothetical protein
VKADVKIKATLALVTLTQLALFLAKIQPFWGFQHGH